VTKLGAPLCPVSALAELAPYVLIEADGARQLPLKAHEPYEPVIPEETRCVIQIIGVSGIGQPVGSAVHRPERFLKKLGGPGAAPQTLATPERVAAVLAAERRGDILFINQTETEGDRRNAARLAECAKALGYRRIVSGSIREGRIECLY
jgi:probable selenium-dependent hydroxylase accessory protein YqeC